MTPFLDIVSKGTQVETNSLPVVTNFQKPRGDGMECAGYHWDRLDLLPLVLEGIYDSWKPLRKEPQTCISNPKPILVDLQVTFMVCPKAKISSEERVGHGFVDVFCIMEAVGPFAGCLNPGNSLGDISSGCTWVCPFFRVPFFVTFEGKPQGTPFFPNS